MLSLKKVYHPPPSYHSSPSYPVNDQQFAERVEDTVLQLYHEVPDLLPEAGVVTTDAIASVLLYCGIPVGDAGINKHKECVTAIAEEIRNNGFGWYNEGIHRHSIHNAVYSNPKEIGENRHLAFAPGFRMNQDCNLGKIFYSPRFVQKALLPLPSKNTDFQPDSTSNVSLRIDNLPEHFDLMTYNRDDGSWTVEQHFSTRPSLILFSMDKIYGIQEGGTPERILTFFDNQMIESPVNNKVGKKLYSSGLNDSIHENKRYWLYQRTIQGKGNSKRENQGWRSYFNAVMHRNYLSYQIELPFPYLLYLTGIVGVLLKHQGIIYPMAPAILIAAHHTVANQTPYADPEQEAINRYGGLTWLLNHYLQSRDTYSHFNMLASLLDNIEEPLGVMKYASFVFEKGNEKRVATEYAPLSQLPYAQQKEVFSKAIKYCSFFFKEKCDFANDQHREYTRFFLVMCTESDLKSCGLVWKDKDSRVNWQMLINEYDWGETSTLAGRIMIDFSGYFLKPAIHFDRGTKKTRLSFEQADYPFFYTKIIESDAWVLSWFGPFAHTLSVDEMDECLISSTDKTRRCVYNKATRKLLMYHSRVTAWTAIRNTAKPYSWHAVSIEHGQLRAPDTNRKQTWYKSHNVRAKECSEITPDNLRDACIALSPDNFKQFLAFVLELIDETYPWTAVYRPVANGNNASKTSSLFGFTGRVLIKDMPTEQLITYIDFLAWLCEDNGVDPERLIADKAFMNILAEIGMVDLSSSDLPLVWQSFFRTLHLNIYKERYKTITRKRMTSTTTTCQMQRLQQKKLCNDDRGCIAMMPGWDLLYNEQGDVQPVVDHLMPVWLQKDQVFTTIPTDGPKMLSSQYHTLIGGDEAESLYEYIDYKQKRIVLSYDHQDDHQISYSRYKTNTLYLKKFNHDDSEEKYSLFIIKDEVMYSDPCGIDEPEITTHSLQP